VKTVKNRSFLSCYGLGPGFFPPKLVLVQKMSQKRSEKSGHQGGADRQAENFKNYYDV
jgi:hypothetical protein